MKAPKIYLWFTRSNALVWSTEVADEKFSMLMKIHDVTNLVYILSWLDRFSMEYVWSILTEDHIFIMTPSRPDAPLLFSYATAQDTSSKPISWSHSHAWSRICVPTTRSYEAYANSHLLLCSAVSYFFYSISTISLFKFIFSCSELNAQNFLKSWQNTWIHSTYFNKQTRQYWKHSSNTHFIKHEA